MCGTSGSESKPRDQTHSKLDLCTILYSASTNTKRQPVSWVAHIPSTNHFEDRVHHDWSVEGQGSDLNPRGICIQDLAHLVHVAWSMTRCTDGRISFIFFPTRWGSLDFNKGATPSRPSTAPSHRARASDPWSSFLDPNTMPDRMSEYMSECEKECRNRCQIECLNRFQEESQNRCQIECQRMPECQQMCQKVCQTEWQTIWPNRMSEYANICHVYFQMVCQKLCQNSVPGWGSQDHPQKVWIVHVDAHCAGHIGGPSIPPITAAQSAAQYHPFSAISKSSKLQTFAGHQSFCQKLPETSGTFRTPGPPCGRWSTAVPHHRRFFLQWMCHLSYTVHSSKSKDSKVSFIGFIEVKKFQHDISWFMITKAYKTHQNAKDVEKQHVGWKSQQESNVSGTSAALQISHHFPSDFFSSIAWSLAWSLACHAHSWGITWIRSMCYDVLWECLCCPHLESDDRLSWGKHV